MRIYLISITLTLNLLRKDQNNFKSNSVKLEKYFLGIKAIEMILLYKASPGL